MAVKKSKPAETAAKTAAAPKKATTKPAVKAKKAATKPAVKAKKASTTKVKEAAPVAAPEPVAKVEAPKKAAAKKAASAAPKKAAAVVKLTENQLKFLKQIQDTKEGFLTAKKAELKTLETLLEKKLIKKGAKDKASGSFRFTVSKAGEKHLSTLPPA